MSLSFPHLIERNANTNPDSAAIICGERVTSWARLHHRCEALAGGFDHIGLAPGDRVGFIGLNSAEFYECYFAPSYMGCETVALNWRLSVPELVECVEDSAPKLLIADAEFINVARQVLEQASVDFRLIVTGAEPQGDELSYEELIAEQHANPYSPGSGDDTLLIFYSGGTTGRAKGIMLTHWNMFANANGVALHMDLKGDDVHLLIGPMFHLAAGARVFASVYCGCAMVILPKFTPRDFLSLIQKHRVTSTLFIPAMMPMILDLPDFATFDLSSLRQMSFGASASTDDLLHRIIAAFPHVDIRHGYGMTEASPLISVLGPEYHRADAAEKGKLGAVGFPPPHVDLRIFDETDHEVPQGEVGEIVVRGPNVMKGYLNRPDLTAETLRGGWLHTGDAGYFDADGCLWISGRIKDMIISGGENVYPGEVENVLSLHPQVADVAVIGIPHEKWGEAVHAIVIPVEGQAPDPETLIAYCRDRIAGYKCPQSVSFRGEPMPLSGANKVLKSELRKPFWEGGAEPDGSVQGQSEKRERQKT